MFKILSKHIVMITNSWKRNRSNKKCFFSSSSNNSSKKIDVIMEETKNLMKQCEKKINRIKKIFKDDIKQYEEIESIMLNETNVESHQHSKNDINIMQNYNMLSKRLNNFLDLKLEYKNIKELINELLQEDDAVDNLELYNECQDDLNSMLNQCNRIYITSQMNGEADNHTTVFLEVQSGAGGDDANDWASMLLNMYLMHFEKENNFNVMIEDMNADNGSGRLQINTVVNNEMNYLYGFLKHEQGIHRLVRISPYDSKKRRHTSFASVNVYPSYSNNIFDDGSNNSSIIDLVESELKIDTFKSSGAGGQHVNTTDSAVRITHLPTNTVVSCRKERSQHQNKRHALIVLKSKLYKLQLDLLEKKKKEQYNLMESNSFGSHFRSYVLHPYTQVKDHKSGYITNNVNDILNGNLLHELLEANLGVEEEEE